MSTRPITALFIGLAVVGFSGAAAAAPADTACNTLNESLNNWGEITQDEVNDGAAFAAAPAITDARDTTCGVGGE